MTQASPFSLDVRVFSCLFILKLLTEQLTNDDLFSIFD